MNSLSRFFAPPLGKTLEEGQKAAYVHALIFLGLAICGVLATLGALGWVRNLPAEQVIAAIIGLALIFALNKRGFFKAARYLLVGFLLFETNMIVLSGKGIHDVGIMLYPILLLLASYLLSRREVWWLTGLTLASLALVIFGDWLGWFPAMSARAYSPQPVRPGEFWTASSIILLGSLTAQLLVEALRRSGQEARENEVAYAQSNAMLRTAEERWRMLVNNAPNTILRARPDGSLVFINHPGAGKNLPTRISELFVPQDHERLAAFFEKIIVTCAPGEFSGMMLTDLGPRWHTLSAAPVINQDRQVLEVVFIATDTQDYRTLVSELEASQVALEKELIERERAEEKVRQLNAELEARVQSRTRQLQEANQEMESFTYTVSHDLRTPLRSINGFSRILQEDFADNLSAEGNRYLERIAQSAVRMGALIDDLLTFSRLGRQAMRWEVINITAMVSEIAAEQSEFAPKGKINIQIEPLPESWGDPPLLRQALSNLLSNAIKYSSPRESVQIHIGTGAEAGETVFFIRDNGVGFDMAHAAKLFGVFQRLHGMDEFEGTGVGLAIVKRVIERHGGRIWANSQPGQGATFFFTLGEKPAITPYFNHESLSQP